MAVRSKLDWLKSLRGADLTPTEVFVLVLLASYSNADLENAHPSVERLAADSGKDVRTVQRILRNLEATGAVEVTEEGGNQVRKGAATVYRILTPPNRPKGDTSATLPPVTKGDTSATLPGDRSKPPRVTYATPKGDKSVQPRVAPAPPHQVKDHQVKDHHADASASGAAAASPHPDDFDIEAILDGLNADLDSGMTAGEMTKAEAMLQRGNHPNAVRNKINEDRLEEHSDRRPRDLSKLLARQTDDADDPRCAHPHCGISQSRHDRGMAQVEADKQHPFQADLKAG